MKTADVRLDEDLSNKSPLEQLAMAGVTAEEAIEKALPSTIMVEGKREVHDLQRCLHAHGWQPTNLETYSKLESRVYQKYMPDSDGWGTDHSYATLVVGNFLGVFGELKITTRKP